MFRQHSFGPFLIFSTLLGAACLVVAGCAEPEAKLEPVEFTNPLLEPDFTMDQLDAIAQLSEDEKPAVKAVFDSRKDAFAEWLKLRGKEVEETQAKLKDAEKNGEETLRRSYEVRLRPALEARRALLVEHQELILAAMSKESVERWQAHVVVEKLLQLAEPLKLSSDQQQTLRADSLAVVKEFPPGEERLSGAFFRLEKILEGEVLTPGQLEQYQRIKKANPRRGVTW